MGRAAFVKDRAFRCIPSARGLEQLVACMHVCTYNTYNTIQYKDKYRPSRVRTCICIQVHLRMTPLQSRGLKSPTLACVSPLSSIEYQLHMYIPSTCTYSYSISLVPRSQSPCTNMRGLDGLFSFFWFFFFALHSCSYAVLYICTTYSCKSCAKHACSKHVRKKKISRSKNGTMKKTGEGKRHETNMFQVSQEKDLRRVAHILTVFLTHPKNSPPPPPPFFFFFFFSTRNYSKTYYMSWCRCHVSLSFIALVS